jgi:hypothetical protein
VYINPNSAAGGGGKGQGGAPAAAAAAAGAARKAGGGAAPKPNKPQQPPTGKMPNGVKSNGNKRAAGTDTPPGAAPTSTEVVALRALNAKLVADLKAARASAADAADISAQLRVQYNTLRAGAAGHTESGRAESLRADVDAKQVLLEQTQAQLGAAETALSAAEAQADAAKRTIEVVKKRQKLDSDKRAAEDASSASCTLESESDGLAALLAGAERQLEASCEEVTELEGRAWRIMLATSSSTF